VQGPLLISFVVQSNSLNEHYSSKTHDELLALAGEQASLTEEARLALADELQRRGLSAQPLTVDVADVRCESPQPRGTLIIRARWVGMWFFSTLVATVGVAITVGLLTYSTQSFTTRATRIHLLTPYYPVPIMVGLVVGCLSYTRLKGSYRYWAWVAPAVLVLASLLDWKAGSHSAWPAAMSHFFGPVPYPDNRDQRDTSVVLYMAIAYSIGAFVQSKLQEWMRVEASHLKESE
jgi:hypothetical protein